VRVGCEEFLEKVNRRMDKEGEKSEERWRWTISDSAVSGLASDLPSDWPIIIPKSSIAAVRLESLSCLLGIIIPGPSLAAIPPFLLHCSPPNRQPWTRATPTLMHALQRSTTVAAVPPRGILVSISWIGAGGGGTAEASGRRTGVPHPSIDPPPTQ
jgi:hypothetical protein